MAEENVKKKVYIITEEDIEALYTTLEKDPNEMVTVWLDNIKKSSNKFCYIGNINE